MIRRSSFRGDMASVGSTEVVDQILPPLSTDLKFLHNRPIGFEVRLGGGLILQPDQFSPEVVAGQIVKSGGDGGHRVGCVDLSILQHRAAGSGVSYKTSESDRVGSRGRDGSIMGGSLFDALGFQIGGDRLQDRQQLGAIGGTVQEGGCQVAGHGRIVGLV